MFIDQIVKPCSRVHFLRWCPLLSSDWSKPCLFYGLGRHRGSSRKHTGENDNVLTRRPTTVTNGKPLFRVSRTTEASVVGPRDGEVRPPARRKSTWDAVCQTAHALTT